CTKEFIRDSESGFLSILGFLRTTRAIILRRNTIYTSGAKPPLFSPPRRGRCKRGILPLSILLRAFENRFGDGAIGAATADVAAHPVGNLLARGIRIFHQKCLCGHNLPRRAVTALSPDVADESLLQRIQLIAVRHSLDGEHGF